MKKRWKRKLKNLWAERREVRTMKAAQRLAKQLENPGAMAEYIARDGYVGLIELAERAGMCAVCPDWRLFRDLFMTEMKPENYGTMRSLAQQLAETDTPLSWFGSEFLVMLKEYEEEHV